MNRTSKQIIRSVAILPPLFYFAPAPALFYLLCGAYDVIRNRRLDVSIISEYFLGNGLLTWLLSPFNLLMDLLSLPYPNQGVYRLEDLSPGCQAEIRQVIDVAHQGRLVERLEEWTRGHPRTMIFFKWYGANEKAVLDVPGFQRAYRHVQTIGVSVFNERQSTSRHFGPLRATLRLLYNLNDVHDPAAYIVVGNVTHRWNENKLFIFDDTLLHQSFNDTDQARYCLFVDILRPSLFPRLSAAIVSLIRVLIRGINHVFYKNWKVM